jgi:hypothetical protein
MVVDWSVECSVDDPVLVVPWSGAEATAEVADTVGDNTVADFVDLRENPYDMDQIPEAEQNPPLMQALRALNAGRSPVFTAKCDAWVLDEDELEQLRSQLDLAADRRDAAAGFASYIDLVWRDRAIFASFHQSEQLLHRLQRLAAPIEEPLAMLDCVLRPALIDLTGPQEGFAVSLYVKALGPDSGAAKAVWGSTLEAVVALLRGKEISLA